MPPNSDSEVIRYYATKTDRWRNVAGEPSRAELEDMVRLGLAVLTDLEQEIVRWEEFLDQGGEYDLIQAERLAERLKHWIFAGDGVAERLYAARDQGRTIDRSEEFRDRLYSWKAIPLDPREMLRRCQSPIEEALPLEVVVERMRQRHREES